jgi:hypothetical protein
MNEKELKDPEFTAQPGQPLKIQNVCLSNLIFEDKAKSLPFNKTPVTGTQ